jgi:hypothetical protein
LHTHLVLPSFVGSRLLHACRDHQSVCTWKRVLSQVPVFGHEAGATDPGHCRRSAKVGRPIVARAIWVPPFEDAARRLARAVGMAVKGMSVARACLAW